jgi:hypothetical protein
MTMMNYEMVYGVVEIEIQLGKWVDMGSYPQRKELSAVFQPYTMQSFLKMILMPGKTRRNLSPLIGTCGDE